MIIRRLSFSIALLISAQSMALAASWTEYSPPDQSFKVAFPAKPSESNRTDRDVTSHILTVTMKDGNGPLAYIVTYNEFPKKLRNQRDSRGFLDGAQKGFLNNSAARIVATREIALGPVPGREFVVDGIQGKWTKTRVYGLGNRGYTLMVLANDRETLESADALKFLDSFELQNVPAVPFEPEREEESLSYRMGQLTAYAVMGIVGIVALVVLIRCFQPKRQSPPRRRELDDD